MSKTFQTDTEEIDWISLSQKANQCALCDNQTLIELSTHCYQRTKKVTSFFLEAAQQNCLIYTFIVEISNEAKIMKLFKINVKTSQKQNRKQ